MTKLVKLKFLKAGLLTLVVDSSKLGYQKYGVPTGGAMDTVSAEKANWLVGNEMNTPVLEINMVGPQILFEDDCQIAITGADISPVINGASIKMYETLTLRKGSILQFGRLNSGSRAYLAIKGNWSVPDWLDANSAKNISTLESLHKIEIQHGELFISNRKTSKPIIPKGQATVKVMNGPEFNLLPNEVRYNLLNSTFKLLPASNRMGYRLTPKLPEIGMSIISSGVVPGTLQITEKGYPILLLQDGPATGGYVRALQVISEDMCKLGQLKAGDILNFKLTK